MGENLSEPAVELLSDHELLILCESRLKEECQTELSGLLEQSREGKLRDLDRERLEDLLQVYRRGLIRKAQALKLAVARGLVPQQGLYAAAEAACPHDAAEKERRRNEQGGISLAEFWKRIGAR